MSDRSFVWQFSPALRPFLQTVVISMVSYGEMYGKHQTGLGGSRYASSEIASCCGSSRRAPLPGLAALSLLTSAKYVIDPELRGAQFERITQNLDMDFWKSFWNLTESGLLTVGVLRRAPAHLHTDTVLSLYVALQGFSRMASSPVQVNLTLALPPVALLMPLAADPRLTTTVSPPVAHWGPGPVHVRLISCELREGQVSLRMRGLVHVLLV